MEAGMNELPALGVGLLALAILWILYRLLGGTWDVSGLYCGTDHRPSTSKFQFFLWTIVVFFSYVSIYAARCTLGSYGALPEFRKNLLVVMGLSAATMVTAKGITTAYVASGRIAKQDASAQPSRGAASPGGKGGLYTDDDGYPDLSKVQVLSWTFIAIAIYLIQVESAISAATLDKLSLPDIDSSLIALMGLGQAAYLGKKLTTTDTPRITGISPGTAKPGTKVVLGGLSLGNAQDGSVITLDDSPTDAVVSKWSDTSIEFVVPPAQAGGTNWLPGQRVTVGVVVSGLSGANTVPLTITP
jgi:hypothetical protein